MCSAAAACWPRTPSVQVNPASVDIVLHSPCLWLHINHAGLFLSLIDQQPCGAQDHVEKSLTGSAHGGEPVCGSMPRPNQSVAQILERCKLSAPGAVQRWRSCLWSATRASPPSTTRWAARARSWTRWCAASASTAAACCCARPCRKYCWRVRGCARRLGSRASASYVQENGNLVALAKLWGTKSSM